MVESPLARAGSVLRELFSDHLEGVFRLQCRFQLSQGRPGLSRRGFAQGGSLNRMLAGECSLSLWRSENGSPRYEAPLELGCGNAAWK